MFYVSILILMDLVLLQGLLELAQRSGKSFNPYFNGSSTSTIFNFFQESNVPFVSILILMDLVLLLKSLMISLRKFNCFNPYFNGSSTSTRNILV